MSRSRVGQGHVTRGILLAAVELNASVQEFFHSKEHLLGESATKDIPRRGTIDHLSIHHAQTPKWDFPTWHAGQTTTKGACSTLPSVLGDY